MSKLKWPKTKLSSSYNELVVLGGRFDRIARRVTKNKWIEFNLMRDQGISLNKISSRLKLTRYMTQMTENIRKCIIKWDSDWEKVAKCINGEIDP